MSVKNSSFSISSSSTSVSTPPEVPSNDLAGTPDASSDALAGAISNSATINAKTNDPILFSQFYTFFILLFFEYRSFEFPKRILSYHYLYFHCRIIRITYNFYVQFSQLSSQFYKLYALSWFYTILNKKSPMHRKITPSVHRTHLSKYYALICEKAWSLLVMTRP